jgi:exodeoxyribonuclease III
MKILSWNVNGLRSIQKKGDLDRVIRTYDPDVICLQEIKCDDATARTILAEYCGNAYEYKHVIIHASTCKKGGYAGVALISKIQITEFSTGFQRLDSNNSAAFKDEGRLIVAKTEHNIAIVCCYTPNSKPRLERLNERITKWEPLFKRLIKSLIDSHSNIVIVGDLNVAPEDIDIFSPKGHHKSPGFTTEERSAFKKGLLSDLHLVDGFRHLHPKKTEVYTYWSYLGGARNRNKGWRIDHGIVSKPLVNRLADFTILDDVYGSDHCPILIAISAG